MDDFIVSTIIKTLKEDEITFFLNYDYPNSVMEKVLEKYKCINKTFNKEDYIS